jgi:HrpA-like RNA helicase
MSDLNSSRGASRSEMRHAVCKDCLREERARALGIDVELLSEDQPTEFVYNERSAQTKLNRGHTRSDRCDRHKAKHRTNIQGMAVPYIDLQTIGTVLNPEDPSGPFGGLGPMPAAHRLEVASVDQDQFGFGMNESHIREILENLANDQTRVLVVKAGTGTGKSTYMPYRLLDPPADAPIKLRELGPIVVTEPRVQATTGVAGFVGEVMSGAGGVGPGYPVGFQVSGNRAHDDSCELIYVTDGTMINWLREGRLSTIGTVIVDEAHERSTNIDFIMGYLKEAVDRYPHLRVIVTSATFDERFYQEYFGGRDKVGVVNVPAVKTIGYGFPLFPELDSDTENGELLSDGWRQLFGDDLPLIGATGDAQFVANHFASHAPALKPGEVSESYRGAEGVGWPEDLHQTTRTIMDLRFKNVVPVDLWKDRMPATLAQFVVQLARGLDDAHIFGDILGFLPTQKSIEEAVGIINRDLGYDDGNVFALLSTLETGQKEAALAARRKGDPRKIVISTNLAETSLTVEGVRFVVDSGLIAQSEWDPAIAGGGIFTKPHSQAGIRQRWGRVGRKAPGWVFPLYTKAQFLQLSQDTSPGSARSNLEQLIMTAKLGGIGDVVGFDWPAKFLPPDGSGVTLDESAIAAREVFLAELERAEAALQTSGAVDSSGDPSAFGKELARAPKVGTNGTTAGSIAIMHADRLACVPEVVTILHLLEANALVGEMALLLDKNDWPDEWRVEAAERHRALASGCQDDAELVLQVMSVWERTDPGIAPWLDSDERRRWARRWWINHDALRACAEVRRTVLEGLSPAMKEEVKRFVEPALTRRARGAITRAMASLEYRLAGDGIYMGTAPEGAPATTAIINSTGLTTGCPKRVIPLRRASFDWSERTLLSNLITVEEWALPPQPRPGEEATSVAASMELLLAAAEHGKADTTRDALGQLQNLWPAGLRVLLDLGDSVAGRRVVGEPRGSLPPAELPTETNGAPESGAPEGEELEDGSTVEDASPELDTTWPTPVETEPDPSFESFRAVLNVEEHEIDLNSCNDCEQCRQGNPELCSDPVRIAGRVTDELADWRDRATRNLDVGRPLVKSSDGELVSGRWYEVIGYDVDGPVPAIVVRPDWRPPGSEWRPAEHRDLDAGQLIEVEARELVYDHRGPVRMFSRVDGGGRFLLREAPRKPEKQDENRQLAISLSRRSHGLIERLSPGVRLWGHVIPRPQTNCATLTFLGLLSGHWGSRLNRYESIDTLRPDGSSSTGRAYAFRAIDSPNEHGYVNLESLLRDGARDVVHLFSMKVDGGSAASDPHDLSRVDVGSAVLAHIRPEVARLNVGGLAAERLQTFLQAHPDAFFDPGPPTQGGSSDVVPALTELESVPGNWQVARRGGPLQAGLARELAALRPDSRQWLSDCWYFWARTRHLQPVHQSGLRPGATLEPVEVAADAKVLGGEDQASLSAVAISTVAPEYWTRFASRHSTQLAEMLGATGVFVSGDRLQATYDNDEDGRRGCEELRRALGLPAASIEIPSSVAGALIGKGGERLREASSAPGIWIYEFDNRSSTLLVVGEADAVSAAVTGALRRVGATGRLLLPSADKNGLLIGRGGSTKQQLLERSGCTFANPLARESNEWRIQGPDARSIEHFIELAQSVVPGVTGAVTAQGSATVVDLRTHQPVAPTYLWSGAEPPEVRIRSAASEPHISPTTAGPPASGTSAPGKGELGDASAEIAVIRQASAMSSAQSARSELDDAADEDGALRNRYGSLSSRPIRNELTDAADEIKRIRDGLD